MGAQKAAWQAAFVAEAAALTKVEFAEGLVDLVKAFETVPHHVLAAAATAKGYPTIILRLSLAAYRFPRTIGIDGVYSRTIRATRGITAGAGTATSELRVLLLEMMVELNDRWSMTLTVKLYVDDLTLAACGVTERIVKLMVEALDFVVDWLENILLMQVSAKKSQVLASKPSIAVAIEQATASGKVSATSYAKLLGTDAVGGNRRSTANTVKRLQAFKDTLPRQHQLRKLGVNSAQMVQARGAPAYFYGIENMGASDSLLHDARASSAAGASHETSGKSVDIALYAVDGPNGTLDPAFDAHVNVVKYWALAHFEMWFSASSLAKSFRAARLRIQQTKASPWRAVTGPAAAVIATLARIGWTTTDSTHTADDLGTAWDFVRDSPAAIAQAVKASVRRWRLNRIAKHLPGLAPDELDIGTTAPGEKTILIDFATALAPVLKGKTSE